MKPNSYPPIKANLPRDGEPAYRIPSTDPFPTPSPEEAGTTLMVTDTGDEHSWTGAMWVQTHVKALPISREYFTDVGGGNIMGESLVAIVARNPTVGTVFQDLWGEGGVYSFPTAVETWEIVSSSPLDTAGGVGARTVFVGSLGDAYAEQTQVVALNGVTPVVLAGTHYRANGLVALTAGSSGINVGKITLRVAAGGLVRSVILADVGRSHDCHYTVPANKSVGVLSTIILFPKDGSGTFRNRFRAPGADASWVTGSVLQLYQNLVPFDFKSRPPAPAGTDVQLQVKADSGLIDVTVIFEMLLKDA